MSASERDECVETLRELVEAFGAEKILRAVTELRLGQRTEGGNEAVAQALRSFCVLIEESDRPKLTGRLIGKLVRLEVATGRCVSYRELARDWGTSKQAVHNKAKIYRARLGLPNLDSTAEARANHRLMNRRNYGGVKP